MTLLMFVAIFIQNASAGSVARQDTRAIVDASGLIAHGVVSAVRAEVSEDGFPLTIYSISVKRAVAGVVRSGTFDVVFPGGQLPDGSIVSSGAPTFEIGDEMLLHAERWKASDSIVLPMNWETAIARRVLDSSTMDHAATASGRALLDWGCEAGSGPIVALPTDDLTTLPPLSWSEFVSQVASCAAVRGVSQHAITLSGK